MTERELLLLAIDAAPDDDAPKLIFADWLEEHGEDATNIRKMVADPLSHAFPDVPAFQDREAGREWIANFDSLYVDNPWMKPVDNLEHLRALIERLPFRKSAE